MLSFWTQDEMGDLINLSHISYITMQEIGEPDSKPIPEATHEVLAVQLDERSFRLTMGTEEQCKAARRRLALMLMAPNEHYLLRE